MAEKKIKLKNVEIPLNLKIDWDVKAKEKLEKLLKEAEEELAKHKT